MQSTRRTGAVFHVSKGSAQGLRHACSGSGLEREALGRAAYRPDPAKTVAAFNSRRRKVYAPGCVNRATAIVGRPVADATVEEIVDIVLDGLALKRA